MRPPGLISLAASLACLAGCMCLPAAHTEQVAFSRDGKTVAWTGQDRWLIVPRRQPDEQTRDLLLDPQTGEFRDVLDEAARAARYR
jgi:hypothetical protein